MKNIKKWSIVGIVSAIILLGMYAFHVIRYQNAFLPHTTVLGVNISEQTPQAAAQKIKNSLNNNHFTLVEDHRQIAHFSFNDVGGRAEFQQALTKLKKQQNTWTLVANQHEQISKKDLNHAIQFQPTQLNNFVTKQVIAINKGRTLAHNAYIAKENKQLVIKPAQDGNALVASKVVNTIKNDIQAGKTTINVKNDRITPTITANSSQLRAAKKQMENIIAENDVYHINGYNINITHDQLYDWVEYQHNKVGLNYDKVYNYVQSLADKYDTYQKQRVFHTTNEGDVKVSGGTYGWSILPKAETKALIKEIMKGKSFARTPIIAGSGYNTDKQDIGNTYIEVSIKEQHEWYYKNGKLIMDSPIVTGKPSNGDATPTGVFYVWDKQRNAVLKGKNDNGTPYTSPVAYWMPINYNGVGLHDSPWQPTYGGDWYKQHGSHGCVNNPPAFMAQLYPQVAVGTPVVIYD